MQKLQLYSTDSFFGDEIRIKPGFLFSADFTSKQQKSQDQTYALKTWIFGFKIRSFILILKVHSGNKS